MASINPEILIWARENSGLSVENASRKLQLRDSITATAEEKLLAYESGDKAPSASLLRRMVAQYRTPLLTFYLSEPPVKSDRGEDFRTLPESLDPRENALVDALIRDIEARQSLLKDALLEDEGEFTLPFVGSVNPSVSLEIFADTISKHLSFSLEQYRSYRLNTSESFKYLRELVESQGVFVLLIGNLGSYQSALSTELFRGFVLSDSVAPMIVINDQDSKSAWSFTLLHELAHLFLGQTGVSGSSSENTIERLCNDVASEILLPQSDIESEAWPTEFNLEQISEAIKEFSALRKLSNSLVAYRLYKAHRIDFSQWQKLSQHFKELWIREKHRLRQENSQREGGPTYFAVRKSKLGNALLNFTKRTMQSGAITASQAGFLLGVKPLKVHKLIKSI